MGQEHICEADAALGTDLLIDEDETQHGTAEAPLVGTVLKQNYLKQRRQESRQQLWPLLQVLSHFLHQRTSA